MSRKKMADTRRPQILEGLLNAVADHGLHQCNMSDVAQAAGVSRGILHYYFKNKSEMIAALVGHLKDTKFYEFQSSIEKIDDHFERLKNSLWYPVLAFGKAGAPLAKVWIEFWGIATHYPEILSFIKGLQTELRNHFAAIIEEGKKANAFVQDADSAGIAAVLLATLEGMILQWHIDHEAVSFPGALLALEEMLKQYLLL
jgi:AcrR family transcriptional regulator